MQCPRCDDTGVIEVVTMKIGPDGLPVEESEGYEICECQSSVD